MNIKQFKLQKDEGENYTIAHPSGRSLVVSKKGMSEKAHKIISSLKTQHMDDGGQIASVMPGPDSTSNFTKNDQLSSKEVAANPTAFGQEPAPTPTAVPTPDADTAAIDTSYKRGEALGQQALGAEADLGKQAGQVGKGIDVDTAQKEAFNADQHYQQNLVKYAARSDQIENAISSGKLDPNRIINNMSTGSKVMTGIGLLFGGLGAHVYGGRNPAMDVLNDAITRDIDSQKNSQGQLKELWEMNRQDSNSDLEANLKMHDNYLQMVGAKLKTLGMQAQSPQQQMSLNNSILQIQEQRQQLHQKAAALNTLSSQPGEPANKIRALGMTGLMTPEQQQKAYGELDRVQNLAKETSTVMDLFDKAGGTADTSAENTVLKTAGGLRTPASISGYRAAIMPYLKDAEGRINEQEIHIVQQLEPKPGDTDAKIAAKRQNLMNFLKEKSSSSLLKSYGITPGSQQPIQFKPSK